MNQYLDYIIVDSEIRFGKPTIKGTRIAVSDVLQWFASGMTEGQILEDYPYLSKEQIRAALFFAAHKEELTKIVAA
jgi:uncharacterized protein (DUF433 family)